MRINYFSFQVLWNDTASSDPLPSTRRFINMFFVDQNMDVTDAVVAVRLPYDRVTITGTDPFTFSSNDVVCPVLGGCPVPLIVLRVAN